MSAAIKLREIDIERQIVGFLALDGWRALKTDPCSDRARGKGFGEKGMPDVLFLRYGQGHTIVEAHVMWFEGKLPGRGATGHQKAWHRAERSRGAFVMVAGEAYDGSFDDFVRWYRQSGLLVRVGL